MQQAEHTQHNDKLTSTDQIMYFKEDSAFKIDLGQAQIPNPNPKRQQTTKKFKCKVKYGPTLTLNLPGFTLKTPRRYIQTFKSVKCHVVGEMWKHGVVHTMKSKSFHDVDIGAYNINLARSIMVKLLLSDFDTSDGIVITADMPFAQPNLMNISRPAVLRTYYGLDINCISPTQLERVTYGPTSLTGGLAIDPRVYSTKPMSKSMYEFGMVLKNYAREQFQRQKQTCEIFDCDLNHCTVLTYNAHSANINCKLSYHCDCIYDHNGEFITSRNSQGINTAVIVYSLGDSRTLHFRKRTAVSENGSCKSWKIGKNPSHSFELDNNSIFVLHPLDEKPTYRPPCPYLSQFQHGNVSVETGKLSMALVFRNVTSTLKYDNLSMKRVLDASYIHDNRDQLQSYDETYDNYRANKINLANEFRINAQKKLSHFNWT